MRVFDLIALILDNLSRRKGRVLLTAIGVVIGTAAVVLLVSLATGLQKNATSQLWGIGDLSRIDVYPNWGEGPVMFDSKGMPQANATMKMLTDGAIKEISAIPGIAAVIPRDYLQGGGIIRIGRMETWSSLMGVGVSDLSLLELKPATGRVTMGRGEVVVGSWMAKNFYDPKANPGQETPEQPDLQDQTLTLILQKGDNEGNLIEKKLRIKVVGVLLESRSDADGFMFMNMDEVTAMNEWFMGRRINRNKEGYQNVVVKVEDAQEVIDITDQINALGYQASTQQSTVQGINSFFVVMQVVFGGVGAIALLVAAIGIANTMTMAILERTREIGLMKALGATNKDVLAIFLGEAAGIGFVGGLGGVALGWGGSLVLDIIATGYLAAQAGTTGGLPPTVTSLTPAWLPGFALLFATLIGLISGLYPSLRAATLVPVNALKYE